jgi:MFS family permease
VYPVFQVNELHLNSNQVAILGTFWMVAWCFTYPLWGFITDRIGPRFCLFAGFLLQLFTPLAYSLSDSLPVIKIVSILGGSANSAIDVAWINTLMGMSEKHILQTSSLHMQLSGIRGASLPLIGSLMASSIGGATVFTLSSVFIAVSLIPTIISKKKITRAYHFFCKM